MSRALLHPRTPEAWPEPLRDFLDKHHELFLRWETREGEVDVPAYDRAVYGLVDALQPYSLTGWHCSRLTDVEIAEIMANGMHLPGAETLARRIDSRVAEGLLTPQIAQRLKAKNQAAERYRAGVIWFCFYPPGDVGEHGIERFFRHWGGEALYNSHERDSLTSPAISGIGTPCLVEADVPIATLHQQTNLATRIYRRFLVGRGFRTSEGLDHEDCAAQPLPPDRIRRVIQWPEADFCSLTGCDDWTKPLR